MIAPRYPKGATKMPVQFVASEDAEPQAALIELLARPADAGPEGAVKLETASRQAFALFNRPGELPWHYVFLDKYALAVTGPAPFRIDLERPGVPLSQSGELLLKAKVTRAGDFKGPIEMQPDWLPSGVSKGPTVTIPADRDEATFRIQANDKAAPRVYKIAMNASTTGGDSYSGVGRIRVSSAFVELTVAEAYLSIELQRFRGGARQTSGNHWRAAPGEAVPRQGHREAAANAQGRKDAGAGARDYGPGHPGGVPYRSRPRRPRRTVQRDFVRGGVQRSGPDHPAAHRLRDSARGRATRGGGDLVRRAEVRRAGSLSPRRRGDAEEDAEKTNLFWFSPRLPPRLRVSAVKGLLACFLATSTLLGAAARNKGTPKVPPAAPPAPARPLSFRLDVEPVLFRAGCNSGGCHGAAAGKDGFHLSLFGYDPAGDYWRLTRQIVGRRVDLAAPEQSLLLLKATGMVPHTGGRRFKPDTEYYSTLLRWIQAGAPDDAASVPQVTGISLVPDKVVFQPKDKPRPLQAIARYSDGSTRVVNNLALYLTNNKNAADIDAQGVVTAGKRGDTFVFARFAKYTIGAEMIVLPPGKFKWPKTVSNDYIDDLVYAKLKDLRILPSGPASDEEFLRRASLDLIGLPPTPEEYRAFMPDKDPARRPKLIDRLLERDEFADVWATKWAEVLKVAGQNDAANGTDRKAAYQYYEWIRDQMKRNVPLDQFVRAQVAATGSNLRDPAVNLYTMLPAGQYDAKDVAQDVSQLFTGIRVQCAQCHNHPFDRWTQDDYYGFVSFFTGVKRKQASEEREFYIYDDPNAPPAKHLLDGHPVPGQIPGRRCARREGSDGKAKDPRVALADWLTSKDNALFRQNMANRIWAQFFGRGIVDPVDDVRISNPPSNRELLEALGRHLADYNFDARRLIRDICTSRIYQLASTPNATNRDDDSQFSRARLRRLRADVMLDSISAVTATPSNFNETPGGVRAMQLFEGGHRANNYFLKTFGLCSRESAQRFRDAPGTDAGTGAAPAQRRHGGGETGAQHGDRGHAEGRRQASGDHRQDLHPGAEPAALRAGTQTPAAFGSGPSRRPQRLRRHSMGNFEFDGIRLQPLRTVTQPLPDGAPSGPARQASEPPAPVAQTGVPAPHGVKESLRSPAPVGQALSPANLFSFSGSFCAYQPCSSSSSPPSRPNRPITPTTTTMSSPSSRATASSATAPERCAPASAWNLTPACSRAAARAMW